MARPLELMERYLEVRGAAVEIHPAGLEALLPQEVAAELGLAGEHVRLVDTAERGEEGIAVGFGSPTLDRVVASVTREPEVAEVELPHMVRPKGIGERVLRGLSFLNAVPRAGQELPVTSPCGLWTFRYALEADERHEGLVDVFLNAKGARLQTPAPDWLFSSALGEVLHPSAAGVFGPAAIRAALVAGVADVVAASEGVALAVRRRHARDRRRVEGYFAALEDEMLRAAARGKQTPDALEARARKIEAARKDREAKLAGLEDKYRLRAHLEWATLLVVQVPAVRCDLAIRRRDATFELPVVLNGLLGAVEPLVCAACGASTHEVGVCDEAHHVLCRACLDQTGGSGRRNCPACRQRHDADPEGTFRRAFERLARRFVPDLAPEPATPARAPEAPRVDPRARLDAIDGRRAALFQAAVEARRPRPTKAEKPRTTRAIQEAPRPRAPEPAPGPTAPPTTPARPLADVKGEQLDLGLEPSPTRRTARKAGTSDS